MQNMLSHRPARREDIPALNRLMDAAIRDLLGEFLSPPQVQASHAIMGLDTQLIDDGTYCLAMLDGELVGSGGWSRRATLFGGDHTPNRDARLLDPKVDAARIRAMYTNPAFARRGIGRYVLSLCEAAAAAEGFTRTELAATMGGEPLYRRCGYREIRRDMIQTPGGVAVPIVQMAKTLR